MRRHVLNYYTSEHKHIISPIHALIPRVTLKKITLWNRSYFQRQPCLFRLVKLRNLKSLWWLSWHTKLCLVYTVVCFFLKYSFIRWIWLFLLAIGILQFLLPWIQHKCFLMPHKQMQLPENFATWSKTILCYIEQNRSFKTLAPSGSQSGPLKGTPFSMVIWPSKDSPESVVRCHRALQLQC